MYRTEFWTLWEKARVGSFERTALKHVYYLGWNRSPAQAGCMRQVLGPGALGRPRGIGWRGRWEGGQGWGIHVNPWLIHFNVWQKPLQCCKVINLQLIKINEKKKKRIHLPMQGTQVWSLVGKQISCAVRQLSLCTQLEKPTACSEEPAQPKELHLSLIYIMDISHIKCFFKVSPTNTNKWKKKCIFLIILQDFIL